MTEPLILVPGLVSDGELWSAVTSALGDATRCIIGDTLREATLPDMARRILRDAPPRFALAGISMGGMVALEMVALAPERVTRLALIDTTARPDTVSQKFGRSVATMLVRAGAPFEQVIARGTNTLVDPATSPEVRARLAAMSVRLGPQVFVRQNRALAKRRDLRPVLPGITVPTAVIVGQNDRKAPPGLSREIHALVSGSTLETIAGCGHLPPAEAPDVLIGLMGPWLQA